MVKSDNYSNTSLYQSLTSSFLLYVRSHFHYILKRGIPHGQWALDLDMHTSCADTLRTNLYITSFPAFHHPSSFTSRPRSPPAPSRDVSPIRQPPRSHLTVSQTLFPIPSLPSQTGQTDKAPASTTTSPSTSVTRHPHGLPFRKPSPRVCI